MEYTGILQITSWDENTYSDSECGSKQSLAKITQSYDGDVKGESQLHYLMAYQSKASAVFVGHEVLTLTAENRTGTLVLQHSGTFEDGVAKSSFEVVFGSGKEDFEGAAGSGKFESTSNGQANYVFNLVLQE